MTRLGAVVSQLLLSHLPASAEAVLVTGTMASELVQFLGENQPFANSKVTTAVDMLDQQAPSTKFSLALVVHRFGELPLVEDELNVAKNVLSRVRDVFAIRVLHLVISDSVAGGCQSPWLLADSLAMGFVERGKLPFETGHVALYEFNIHRYKTEPDWLNAKHWAHPERWGRTQ